MDSDEINLVTLLVLAVYAVLAFFPAVGAAVTRRVAHTVDSWAETPARMARVLARKMDLAVASAARAVGDAVDRFGGGGGRRKRRRQLHQGEDQVYHEFYYDQQQRRRWQPQEHYDWYGNRR